MSAVCPRPSQAFNINHPACEGELRHALPRDLAESLIKERAKGQTFATWDAVAARIAELRPDGDVSQ
jgi:hypothetical protein